MREPRILIVGAGIGGLTLARALRQRGLAAELIERAEHWAPLGAGLGLWRNALRILDRLGVLEEVAAGGLTFSGGSLADERGRVLVRVDYAWLDPAHAMVIAILRASLHEILLGGERAVRLGTTLASLSRDQDGVTVALTDGTARSYDLVVGADGLRSRVRELEWGAVPLHQRLGSRGVRRDRALAAGCAGTLRAAPAPAGLVGAERVPACRAHGPDRIGRGLRATKPDRASGAGASRGAASEVAPHGRARLVSVRNSGAHGILSGARIPRLQIGRSQETSMRRCANAASDSAASDPSTESISVSSSAQPGVRFRRELDFSGRSGLLHWIPARPVDYRSVATATLGCSGDCHMIFGLHCAEYE